MSVLGDRLRELRGSQSQKAMADPVNIAYQAWDRYEKGLVSPSADKLLQICRVHACSADWLLGLSDSFSDGHSSSPPAQRINLDEVRITATQIAEEAAALSGTIKKLKKML